MADLIIFDEFITERRAAVDKGNANTFYIIKAQRMNYIADGGGWWYVTEPIFDLRKARQKFEEVKTFNHGHVKLIKVKDGAETIIDRQRILIGSNEYSRD